LKEGEDFLLWNPSAGKALEAACMGKEEFRGMTVFRYCINETQIDCPQPQFDVVDIQINLWIEPLSGTTVRQNSVTTYCNMHSVMHMMPPDYERTISLEGSYSVFDSVSMQFITLPAEVTIAHTANETVNGVLIIDEHISGTNSATGDPLPEFPEQMNTLAVNMVTREMDPDYGDIPREGQFSAPFHLKEGEDFSLWDRTAGKVLNAAYVGKEEFRGITVFVYEAEETNIKLPPDPRSPYDLEMGIRLTLKIEPESGITVWQSSESTIYVPAMGNLPVRIIQLKFTEDTEDELVGLAMGAGSYFSACGSYALNDEVPAFTSDIAFTDWTVDDLVGIAKDARSSLGWFGSYIPWIVICLGAVLVIVSVAVILRKVLQKT